MPQHRRAGVLAHPTSLPGPWGIGELGSETVRFLAWARDAGQQVWQVLPLGPTHHGNSPYNCLSSFAGNPWLISIERLRDDGLVPAGLAEPAPAFPDDRLDYGPATRWRARILHAAWRTFRADAPAGARAGFERFVEAPEQRAWLDDWAVYSALRAHHRGRAWLEWDPELARRRPEALARARHDLRREIEYHRFVQFLFFEHWGATRASAAALGLRVMGDVPIYVALDSADVWAHPQYFELDDDGRPLAVAGVPPDYFSENGQLWGNPLYRWDRLAEDGFSWWVDRVRANLRFADFVRLDHFRAFASYWRVPAGEPTAIRGKWVPGPGLPLFDRIAHAVGGLPFVAEDLGTITDDVVVLKDTLGLPGMKVLQFGFGPDSPHHPDRLTADDVVYTGTHDNDTSRGWYESLTADEQAAVCTALRSDGREIVWDLITAAYRSPAYLTVTPLQDLLGLGSEARMNTPGEPGGNWRWRVRAEALRAGLGARIRDLVRASGRLRPRVDG